MVFKFWAWGRALSLSIELFESKPFGVYFLQKDGYQKIYFSSKNVDNGRPPDLKLIKFMI